MLLMTTIAALGLAIILGLFAPFYSHAFVLHAPVDCTVGEDCFIQNYVDHDSSEGYHDFTCGPLSYDTHKGTDFRLKNLAQMRRGVNVLAAAPGKVRAVRDGMADAYVSDLKPESVKDTECGNGLAVIHAGGYETQYCHMKQGSLNVRPGDKVAIGDVLGQIGLSGKTEFPHLHITLRKDGEAIDPYLGPMGASTCGATGKNLWHSSVKEHYRYRPTGLLQSGFVDKAPTMRDARDGAYENATVSAESAALVFWAESFGIRKGDVLDMRITAPDGSQLVTNQEEYDRNKAVIFNFLGKKKPGGGWPKGIYTAHYTVKRLPTGVDATLADAALVISHEETLAIE